MRHLGHRRWFVGTHCIVLVVNVEDALLFVGEGPHAEKKLGDIVAQSAQGTRFCLASVLSPLWTQVQVTLQMYIFSFRLIHILCTHHYRRLISLQACKIAWTND